MKIRLSNRLASLALLLSFTSVIAARAEKPAPVPKDVLNQLHQAHKVFIANLGDDANFSTLRHTDRLLYSTLYTLVQAWGPYTIVDKPSQANIVFQIRGTDTVSTAFDPEGTTDNSVGHSGRVQLYILDPHDGHALLYRDTGMSFSFTEHFMCRDAEKAIVHMLAPLGYPKRSLSVPDNIPLPSQILHARRVIITPAQDTRSPSQESITRELLASNRFEIVPANPDLIIAPELNSPSNHDVSSHGSVQTYASHELSIALLDPASRITLWSISENVERKRNEIWSDAVDRTAKSLVARLHAILTPAP